MMLRADEGTIFVLKFFYTRGGELRCRVSDARNADRWVVEDPAEVKRILKAAGIRSLTPD